METKRNLIMNKGFIIFTKYIYSISVTKAPTVINFSHNKNIYPLPASTLLLDRVNIFYFEKYTASDGFVLKYISLNKVNRYSVFNNVKRNSKF